ncbi:hypothetical protein MKX78_10665 [Cytobacillus sp. FSL R5-0569]|uniref:hypothetical protein n=1 Tax=Cytobacillus sp. FSL R5-0569 TaxID=2921649 RepID=UPI0030FB9D77
MMVRLTFKDVFFEDDEATKHLCEAVEDISKGKSVYTSIFNDTYDKLDDYNQDRIVGLIMDEFGWDFKSLIDYILKESK